MNIRNRITGHRSVRAGDLVAHPLNWRRHPPAQRAALQALYAEVGFARSLLAYPLPDGRLQLIDGHLRRDLDPDMLVDVEVLDVTAEEANKLLLSMDSLAGLAETDSDTVAELREMTSTTSPALDDLWRSLARAEAETQAVVDAAQRALPEQFLVLIVCRDEAHQLDLLERFKTEGLPCRALIS
jgi:hypothetical protein